MLELEISSSKPTQLPNEKEVFVEAADFYSCCESVG